jgi:hypothetical protein
MIILTEHQANEVKGDYGRYSRLDPVKIPFTDLYMVGESILTDIEFTSIWDKLKVLPQADVKIESNEEGEPISSTIKWMWIRDFAQRIIIPFDVVEKHPELLTYKLWCEHKKLPVVELPDCYHIYCSEVLDRDKPLIAAFNLTVELRC